MSWPAILTFAAELLTWVLMAFGGSVILMVLWAAAGIGSHRTREQAQHGAQKRGGEVRGVVGSRHLGEHQ